MSDLYQKIRRQVEKYHMIRPGDTVLAAVSGGADSVCMLLNLQQYAGEVGNVTLKAVHVEHGIRGAESRKDAAFVEALCRKLDIPCRIFCVDAPAYAKAHGQTLEEAARNLRYEAFAQAAGEAEGKAADRAENRTADRVEGRAAGRVRIATAHNACDQAETMLFAMIRGSRSRGLCGIPPVRDRIIRPMLTVTREEIEAFLEARGQDFCTDSTNLDDGYSRNSIRHRILPELTAINGGALAHMGDLAEHMLQVREDIDSRTESFLRAYAVAEDDGTLRIPVSRLQEETGLMQTEILHAAIERQAGTRKDIRADHVQMVLALADGGTGRQADLPYGLTAAREYGMLAIGRKREGTGTDAAEELHADLSVDGDYTFGDYDVRVRLCCAADTEELARDPGSAPKNAYTKIFDCDKIKSDAVLRFRRPGDYLYLGTDGRRKKLKDFFIDEKTAAPERDRTPLLACGSEVLWIVGLRMGGSAMITQETKRCVSISIEKKEKKG